MAGPWEQYAPGASSTPASAHPANPPWLQYQQQAAPEVEERAADGSLIINISGTGPIEPVQQNPQAPQQPQTSPSQLKGSSLGGIGMGLRDAIDAGAQLLRRAVPADVGEAVDSFGNALSDYGLPVARSQGIAGVDQIVRNASQDYDQSRAMAGRDGIDLARIGGAVINPINRIVPLGAAAGATGLALRAGGQGAISAAATPVLDTDHFGSEKISQIAYGGAAAAAGGVVVDKLLRGASSVVQRVRNALPSGQALNAQQVDEILATAAREQGIDISAIPQQILGGVKTQVAEALNSQAVPDAAALLRRAEGEAVLGPAAGLTLGQSTRNPAQFTAEKNMRGIAGAGEPMMQRYADQNAGLIGSLNQRGAAEAPGAYEAGEQAINALRNRDQMLSGEVRNLYNTFRNAEGIDREMVGAQVAQAAGEVLDTFGRENVPGAVVRKLNEYGFLDVTNKTKSFNLLEADKLLKVINANYDPMQKAQAAALDTLRRGIKETIDAEGVAASGAYKPAVEAARRRFAELEANPAMRAALNNEAPDKFFQRYILNAPAREVAAIAQAVPEQVPALRAQTVAYLKDKALSGASDETGTFSQSGFKRALDKIGDNKLLALFDADQVAQLRMVSRVASNAQSQPAGSAVNNSNTAAATMNLLAQLGGPVARLPGVNLIRNSTQQFLNERAAGRALGAKIPSQMPVSPVNPLGALLAPAAGGLGALTGQAVN